MGMNSTPSANRLHIAFFGCRNTGKSSLVNAVTGQDLAVVSETGGTTTDPVLKAMELLPLGPVVIIDTPGFDDEGALGEKRVGKTRQILNKTDIAVLVTDAETGINDYDSQLLELFQEKRIPYLIAVNKTDLTGDLSDPAEALKRLPGSGRLAPETRILFVSAKTGENIWELKEALAQLIPMPEPKPLVSDLIPGGSTVVLVIPIDESAPRGRLILPQQQVIRDLLDHGNMALAVKETELADCLAGLKEPPALVITDSQAFGVVAQIVPETVPLTSFSILMARHKGFLETALEGIAALDDLQEDDCVLIAEGCTHHRQCNDIGTVKIPRWLTEHCGRRLRIQTCSGTEFPEDLSGYSVIIHCGGCMLNEREMLYRMKCANDQKIPFTNYGTMIAHTRGILERSIRIIREPS